MVVMELVNHLKFLGEDKAARTGIPWPKKRSTDGGPLVANFYMEPSTQFIDYTTSPALKPFVDIRCVSILQMGAYVFTLWLCVLCMRARGTLASSPASHCKGSTLTSPSVHAHDCARPSRAR